MVAPAMLKEIYVLRLTSLVSAIFSIILSTLIISTFNADTARAQDAVRGRTIKAFFTWQRCGSLGCNKRNANVNVYVGKDGTIFDFENSAGGQKARLGVPYRGVTYTASGNVFKASVGGGSFIFALNGSSCTISATVTNNDTAQILSQTCSVVEGPSPKS